MPVLSILVPAHNEARVAIAALKHGVPADLIDRENGQVYIDLFGTTAKTTAVAREVGAEVLAEVDKVYDRMA